MTTNITDDLLDEIDAVLEENDEAVNTPYASLETFTDQGFLKLIELIRTRTGNLYGLSRDQVNPYEQWVELLKFLQDESWVTLWTDPDVDPETENPDEVSFDFERYSVFLEEIIYQMMFDISILSRASVTYGTSIGREFKDGFLDNITGSGFSKIVASHYYAYDPNEPPISTVSPSSYEIEKLTAIYPFLTPAMQLTVQKYMDYAIPKAYPNREL